MSWRVCTVTALHEETPSARTIVLDVPGWPGHLAGQHVDVRLTAADGYSTARSYSIASAPNTDGRVEITVVRLADGEVSPYLTQELAVGDKLEVRGPLGGWFVWRPERSTPVQLVAGGSGLVPLMAMLRTRTAERITTPFRLLYSVRDPDAILYRDELHTLSNRNDGVDVTIAYTRVAPPNSPQRPHRVDAELVSQTVWPVNNAPDCYVCGPTAFVETAARFLTGVGYDPHTVKTERFGPTGEPS